MPWLSRWPIDGAVTVSRPFGEAATTKKGGEKSLLNLSDPKRVRVSLLAPPKPLTDKEPPWAKETSSSMLGVESGNGANMKKSHRRTANTIH